MTSALLTAVVLSALALTCEAHWHHFNLNFRPEKQLENGLQKIGRTKLLNFLEDVGHVEVHEPNLESCKCQKYTCGCCVHVQMKHKLKMNETACLTVTYLPDEIGLELKLTLNGVAIIDKKVSVTNPPAVCAQIPHIHKLASICIKFHDLGVKNKHLVGCADLEVELAFKVMARFKLGCFHIPPTSEEGRARMTLT